SAVVLIPVHAYTAGQGEAVGQCPLVLHEHGPAPASQLVGAVGHVELVALILQILVAVLATHAQAVIPKLKLGVGVGYGVDELHLATGIGVLFPLQIAGVGAKVVAAVVGDGVVGALVSAQAGLGLGRDGVTRRAITILQTAAGL